MSKTTPARRQVLIVEDSHATQNCLAAILRPYRSLDLAHAETFAEALAALGSGRRFDVVLLDLDLAPGRGEDLFAPIADLGDPEPRVVVASGSDDLSRLAATWRLRPRPVAVLTKPYDLKSLLDAILGPSEPEPKG